MSVYNLYSERNKKPTTIYSYNSLPKKLRIQILHIWRKFFNQFPENFREEVWNTIHSILSKTFGQKTLLENDYFRSFYESHRVEFYFEEKASLDECLDTIETVFDFIVRAAPHFFQHQYRIELHYEANQAIDDLNTRFLQNGIGFTLEQGKIIRLDNKLLHKEITKPVFDFLNSPTFKNANQEFLSAHEHFKAGRNKECLNDCLKTFETTMKILCHENGWHYDKQKDTASKLIDICFKNKLVPDYLQSQFTSLKAVLETGVPTARNKLGGHGQGVQQITVPNYLASYVLNLTGTTVFFLISCQQQIKPFS